MAKKRRRPLLALMVAAGLAAGGFALSRTWLRSESTVEITGARVLRGPLRISIVEKGNLKAADYASLRSELEGRTTILYLIDEGVQVKAGDLVCELDATELVEERVEQEIALRNAEAAYVKSKQNYDIQKSQNESDIAGAEQSLTFALEDLKKYREGDRILAEEEAREGITLATEEHTRALEKVEWSSKLAEKGFLTDTELEADRLSLTRAKIQLDQAVREQRILAEYEIPRQIAELEADLEEGHRELDRVKLQAAAKLVDFEADLSTNEAKLNLERDELSKMVEQIGKTKLYAPKDGLVVYSQEESSRYGSSRPMAEGVEIRERQEIITIPSLGGMIAEASLHETFLKQVHPGQSCVVKVDAQAGNVFHGQVKSVAVLPDANSWWANPNTRQYRTEIAIEDASREMRPGMSCSVEIIVKDLEDTLYVPIQAVFRTGAQTICFVDNGKKVDQVDVETGLFNEAWVEIRSGVTEGQVVLLSPPVGFEMQGKDKETPVEEPFWGRDAEAAKGETPSGALTNAPTALPGESGLSARADGAAPAVEAGKSPEGGTPDMTRMRELFKKAQEGDAQAIEELKRMREKFQGSGGQSSGGFNPSARSGQPGGDSGSRGNDNKDGEKRGGRPDQGSGHGAGEKAASGTGAGDKAASDSGGPQSRSTPEH